jgi:hypothetical protein
MIDVTQMRNDVTAADCIGELQWGLEWGYGEPAAVMPWWGEPARERLCS